MIPIDSEREYKEYRPLLLWEASKLSRSNAPLVVIEALDLIHSFYVEEWAKVKATYKPGWSDNPDRETFRPYVCASFRFFARRRMLKLEYLRSRSLDVDTLYGEIAVLDSDAMAADEEHDASLIRAGMKQLPANEQSVLHAYLMRPSIRKVAQHLGISRFRVKQELGNAVARLAMEVAVPGGISKREWAITCLMLGKGGSITCTAKKLNLTPKEVRETHRRNIIILLQRLTASFGADAKVL